MKLTINRSLVLLFVFTLVFSMAFALTSQPVQAHGPCCTIACPGSPNHYGRGEMTIYGCSVAPMSPCYIPCLNY